MTAAPPGPDRSTTAGPSGGPIAMDAAGRRAILAASAPWVAALLNLLPGLGSGYLYQRRWRAWWCTTALAGAWALLGTLAGRGPEPSPPSAAAPAGIGGLLLLALVTMVEAFLAGRKARMD